MTPSPYPLKNVGHISVSALKLYMACEAQGAYQRNYLGIPKPALPVPIAFGIAAHKLLEQAGKFWWGKTKTEGHPLGSDEGRNFVRYGTVFVAKVLAGQKNPRGTGRPAELQWWSESARNRWSPEELVKRIAAEKQKYQGKIWNILEALRLEFTQPLAFRQMHFEYIFGTKQRPATLSHDGWQDRFRGQVDRIEVDDSGYEIWDYKTGWIVKLYQTDRIHLVEDLQMTGYWEFLRKHFGTPPRQMYFLPLEFRSEDLKRLGPGLLRSLRVCVPARTEEHLRDMALLARDVHAMLGMIVKWRQFSDRDREEWVPRSSYARKAGFAESVREARFKARPGPHCLNCPFVNVCPTDHPQDWSTDRQEQLVNLTGEEGLFAPPPSSQPEKEPQPWLFSDLEYRSPHYRKPEKTVRERLLASGGFVRKDRFTSQLNAALKLLESQGTCPCLDLNLRPKFLFAIAKRLAYGEEVKPAELGQDCPFDQCPRRRIV